MKYSAVIAIVTVGLSLQNGFANEPQRTNRSLQVLYDFSASSGPVVSDRSLKKPALDLKIQDMSRVRRSPGTLQLTGKTSIRSLTPAKRLTEAIRKSQQLTVEAWVRSNSTRQQGPARIVSISSSPTSRNFTLGQEFDRFDVRLRTTRTSKNGIPSLETGKGAVQTKLTHIVYTRDRSGQAKIYTNGKVAVQRRVNGDLSNWAPSMNLFLANEAGGDRAWLGSYHLVAIYSTSLSAPEVQANFQAGPGGRAGETLAAAKNQLEFETKIAPILANHCIECHDPATKGGGLDLSTKQLALSGGESGKALVKGNVKDSLLWQLIEENEMPKNRDPLSAAEKQTLEAWIAGGASWTLDVIDPAVYVHHSQAGGPWIQRLTIDEYIQTVKAAVGVDISKEAKRLLPPDLRADGFSNTAYNLTVDLKHIDAYSKLAEMIVERMDIDRFAQKFSRSRKLIDRDNRDLIAKMGKWVLRGPLEEKEIVSYRGIATTVASAGGDFSDATRYIIQAMLQSPRFIYRVEQQRGDGTDWPADRYELASRISYIVWGGPPDETLSKLADEGRLDTKECAAQVDRMLKDPRARRKSRIFASDWLHLDRLDNLRPDPQKYPNWKSELAQDMKRETMMFFEDVVWEQELPLVRLMNSRVSFLTPRLAKHYGIPLPRERVQSGSQRESRPISEPVRIDLSSASSRGGLLTQGSILTIGGDEASMVTRGLFVMHNLLRGVVKDPPPCVDTTPVPSKAGLTQRSIAEARIADKNCGGCHARFEPLAFGLEKFDGLGGFANKDRHGNLLRDDGNILVPRATKPAKYKSSRELMDLLAKSDRVAETLTWKLTQFSLGRPLGAKDAREVAKIHRQSQNNGGTYTSIIKAIVLSDLVQMTRTTGGLE